MTVTIEAPQPTANPLGSTGDDIGNNTLWKTGGHDVEFADLSQIEVPEDTETYTAVPHTDFVRAMYKHADNILAPKGFTLAGEQYITNETGERLFFVHHYRNGDEEMNMAMGCRNSYDRSMKAAVAFGARVDVCENLNIHGDINIMRSHRGNAIDYLNEQIILSMYKASDGWDDSRRDRDDMSEYSLDEDDGYALMGLIKAHTGKQKAASSRILQSNKEWKAVQEYWAEPQHEYSGGNRTLWAWYNSFTFDFKGLKPHEQLPKHASLHRFVKSALTGFNGSQRATELIDRVKAAESNDDAVIALARMNERADEIVDG